MKISKIINETDLNYTRGFFDDVLFAVVYFMVYLYGYNLNCSDIANEIDIDFEDLYCFDIFKYWVYCLSNARDICFTNLIIEYRICFFLSNYSLSEVELLRLTIMKRIVDMSFVGKGDNWKQCVIKIIDFVSPFCSIDAYNKCLILIGRI